jgi:phosphoglycerol transferase
MLFSAIVLFIGRGTTLLKWFLRIWLTSMMMMLVYMEVLTPTFILEYDLRPNRLFIEYLIYPKEVFSMLWTGYKLEILLSTIALVITVQLSVMLFNARYVAQIKTTIALKLTTTIVLILMLFIGARSSLGHRPINPAMMAFSTDHLLNDLTLNSTYSVIHAALQMANDKSSEQFYGKMSDQDVIDTVRATTLTPASMFTDPEKPTQAYKAASYKGKPKNLVIILQESLGARYVGGLGGLPLTPNLDQLMREGWNFSNLFATGTRSVRGIEAVVTGFTPTPARAVVKLDKSQRDFFTIADFLVKQNYHTQFIYGGESHFDNMKGFFLGNGFKEIIDSPSFDKIDFEGSWGASDEDLFDQADKELTWLAASKQPFFSLVFTSSNHSPYEFPDNKINLYDAEKNTRNNAVKYADFALGKFFSKAKASNYWKDTVFIVIADHDSRVAGANLVPIEHFRIPGIILGEGITPKVDQRLTSHIDIAPTLLSLIGVSGDTPMLGHDMTQDIPSDKLRAMMQYDKNFAYMTNDSVTILQPQKAPLNFDYKDNKFTQKQLDRELAKRAKASVVFGSKAYEKGWYQ